MKFFWSELSTVSGKICCTLDITYLLYTVYDSAREQIYCILDIIHILEWTVQLCKLSEYLYTDILCNWISNRSQDKEILCYQTLNRSQDTDICVLMDIGQITGQNAGYSGQS